MTKPPTPPLEAQRLAALAQFAVLDTLPEAEYDDITRLAAAICATPMALVSLVDADRQWFKSRVGIDVGQTPRDISFCGHAIAGESPLFIVEDALEDPRFADSPLVVGEPHIRFYAGAQLRTPDGFCIGSLCVTDRVPRTLSPVQKESLLALARNVMRSLQTRLDIETFKGTQARMRLFESAVAHTSEAVVIIEYNRSGTVAPCIRFVNDAFTHMTGVAQADILGLAPTILHTQETPAATKATLRQAISDRKSVRVELELRGKDRPPICVELNLSPAISDDSADSDLWVAIHHDISDRKRADEATGDLLRLTGLIEQMPAIVWVVDCDLRYTLSLGAGLHAIGLAPGQAVGLSLAEFLGDNTYAQVILDAHQAALAGENGSYGSEVLDRTYRSYLAPARNLHGTIVGVVGISLDITDQERDRHALITTEANLIAAQQTAHLGNWKTDLRSNTMVCSAELFALYDLDECDQPLPPEAFRGRRLAEDAQGLDAAVQVAKHRHESYSFDHRIQLRDGRIRWLQERGNFEYDQDGKALISFGTSLDITDRKIVEERLKRLAIEDVLTGLSSRFHFVEQLTAALEPQADDASSIAVVLIDVDHFKTVNDSLGHRIGDLLLCEIANRLQESSGPDDIVARAGGDEFIILTDGNDAALSMLLGTIRQVFVKPFVLNSQDIYCTLSIGVTRAPTDGILPEELLRNVDTAMHAAKSSGRDCTKFFLREMHERVAQRLTLANDLRRAIDRQEFVLYYQPTFDRELRMTAVEALIRWHHPSRGLVPPDEFIPIAEETGLIVPIGAWVIATACRQLADWKRTYGTDMRMAINISGRQFQSSDLCDTLNAAVIAAGIEHGDITLELTESVIMHDIGSAIDAVGEFKALGFHISVDDFGTGYSSLSSLKRLPIDTLKIDRSFIRDTPHDSESCAIVDAVIALGHSLDLTLLAEGVETSDQLEYLLEGGCEDLQGYLLARPSQATVIDELLAATRVAVQA